MELRTEFTESPTPISPPLPIPKIAAVAMTDPAIWLTVVPAIPPAARSVVGKVAAATLTLSIFPRSSYANATSSLDNTCLYSVISITGTYCLAASGDKVHE